MTRNSDYTIQCDVHTHTVHSGHAFSTLNELARAAAEASLELIAITDHGPSMDGAPHAGYFEMVGRLPSTIHGVQILMGIEANIASLDGALDLPLDILRKQQIVLAGLHERTGLSSSSISDHTEAVRRAMENGYVHAISHPYRPGFEVDVRELVHVAAGTGVCLEINVSLIKWATSDASGAAKADVLNQHRRMVEEMERVGAKCTVASDAHHSSEVESFPNSARDVIAALDIPLEMVVNRRADILLKHIAGLR